MTKYIDNNYDVLPLKWQLKSHEHVCKLAKMTPKRYVHLAPPITVESRDLTLAEPFYGNPDRHIHPKSPR